MIKIICIGSLKEKYLKEAQEEYIKRIKKFQQVTVVELQECKIDDKKISLEKEKEQIKKHINPKDYIITLEIDGEELSSEEFSEKIDKTYINNSSITFIIGSSHGLHEEIKSLSNYKLSFSKMTFPHQLFRILLLEQLYRAFKIINNERYHK